MLMDTKISESESRRSSNGAWLLAGMAAGALGSVFAYFALQRRMDRAFRDLRSELGAELANAIARLGNDGGAFVSAPAPVCAPEEISDDVVLLIASAVTAYLGKNVRIRSARRIAQPLENVSPWAQQGRGFLQASHNVAQRGR
jgi:methylmalonyl-CoA carboxyltransferase 12S subunit